MLESDVLRAQGMHKTSQQFVVSPDLDQALLDAILDAEEAYKAMSGAALHSVASAGCDRMPHPPIGCGVGSSRRRGDEASFIPCFGAAGSAAVWPLPRSAGLNTPHETE